ncbi:hypothetical protein EIN_114190 [Entamoeba invadens IP1]|uniref:Ras n=1 Tax=Entamoeba invadens IP1 TaxID=370355 RepID=A0A0A1TXX4_ENTIV|nr:hypothetical protein EIN_114190 [Entamoeba invadens IP1]ELP86275.1 hypothetical protein EIN_114190 [Entamoeba invadens IP1]|eukprot:XP_004185621.1 hypothetical protein EIN_114190 [Entamoeba invadens IP1]
MASPSTCYRIVMLGKGAVGKTSISTQMVSGIFKTLYEPTIEDSFKTSVDLEGEVCTLEILDTAGQDEYNSLRDQYVKMGDGFIIVYSIIEQQSFFDVNIYKDVLHVLLGKSQEEHVNACLCANKLDLEEYRVVPTENGAALAKELGLIFYEVSAKTNINIAEMFKALLKVIKEDRILNEAKRPQEEQKKKKCLLF